MFKVRGIYLFLLFKLTFLSFCLSQSSIDHVQHMFKNPPQNTRPLVWWRWYGRQVSREGITRDFEQMKKVGIGGVYHFQLKPNLPDVINNSDSKLPNVGTLSSEWWDLMQYSIKEANRLGLEFRMHNSLGWSASGGPWIKPEQSMQKLVWSNIWFKGSQIIKCFLPQPKVDSKWNFYKDIAVIALKINEKDSSIIEQSDIIDISKYMSNIGELNWIAPEGNWKIFRYGHTTTGKTPVQGPIEVEGLECDKMDRNAAKVHFDNYPGKILKSAGVLAGKSLTTIGFDSYEGGLQNWNHNFRIEFIKRRGYDPLTWLPIISAQPVVNNYDPRNKIKAPSLIIGNKEITSRFIYDFERTIAELFMDEYYSPMDSLVHQYPGVQMEVQSYNAPFNLIENAVKNKFPAGEFWHINKGYGWWTLSLAASAGHISGANIIAAESFTTEPQFGNWSISNEALKAEADLAFSKGINSMEMHIQAHQPWGNTVKPGMIGGNYGLQVNPNNTFWKQSLSWNQYLARTQFLLRQGSFVGDICYLYPRGQRGFSVEEGYNGDAIDEVSFINLMDVKNGEWVLPSGMHYKLLVLNETQTMSIALAKKLQNLIAKGGVVLGPKPIQTPSLENYVENDLAVQKIGNEVWNQCNGNLVREASYYKGKVYWNKSVRDVLNILELPMDVKIEEKAPKESIVWIHRNTSDADIYFVANQLKQSQIAEITFRVDGKVPELWNAETGSTNNLAVWKAKEGRTTIKIPFNALQSWFVIFKKNKININSISDFENLNINTTLIKNRNQVIAQFFQEGKYVIKQKMGNKVLERNVKLPNPITLNRDWEADFNHIQGAPGKLIFPALISWTSHANSNVRYFSGTATYTKNIKLSSDLVGKDKLVQIDLGDVKNFAEVSVNGEFVGTLWKAPFNLDITNFVVKGNNTIQVKVTNLFANRMIGDEQEPDDAEWSAPSYTLDSLYKGKSLVKYPEWFINGKPRPSFGRYTFSTWNYYRKEDKLLPSGLLGPVKLVFGVAQKID